MFALRIEKVDSLPRDNSDIIVFQVADLVGKWRKSNRIGPKVHFAPAIPDSKWRSLARSNYQIVVTFKQERKCERSLQPRQHQAYRVDWLASFLPLSTYKMSDHLGVRLRGKMRTGQVELIAQFAMIFDDAIVNDRNAINRVWMRVLFVWAAMGSPASVANAYKAGERLAGKPALKILEFPDCASPRKEAAVKCGDTRGIVPSIFKPLQRIQNRSSGRPLTHDTDDSTHLPLRFTYHKPPEAREAGDA
jgi:hypothetical protein